MYTDLKYNNIRDYLTFRRDRRKNYMWVVRVLAFFILTVIYCVVGLAIALLTENSFASVLFNFLWLIAYLILCVVLIISSRKALKPIIRIFKKENLEDNHDIFNCYHCYKGILTEEIAPITCTVCHTENNFLDLVDECKRCKNPLLYFKCPFCNETMDFINAEYHPEEIRKKLHGQG